MTNPNGIPVWVQALLWVLLALVSIYIGYRHAEAMRKREACRVEGHRWGIIDSGLQCVRCGFGCR